ncbi:universal stress protein [Streptomyces sp. NPDC020742]|uniref:universal stress protein n=1 Tax=Streptomyces sp. NPDC020742 TaxID=3154897 RepID=UPI003400B5E1
MEGPPGTGDVQRKAVAAMVRPLVVGVDGSDPALRALDWAVDEAALHGLELRVVHAAVRERSAWASATDLERPRAPDPAQGLVATAVAQARCRRPHVEVTGEVRADAPVTGLLRVGLSASALVLGSRGHGELSALLLGSVGLAVASRARCPVIVVRGDPAGLAGTHRCVLLGVGEPWQASEAVRFAFREAAARDCLLKAVRTWRCPAAERAGSAGAAPADHERQAAQLLGRALGEAAAAYPEVTVRRTTVEGPAHKMLVHRAAAADLLVVGAGSRHGHFGLPLGRVAHSALCHAACPVAVVPQRA